VANSLLLVSLRVVRLLRKGPTSERKSAENDLRDEAEAPLPIDASDRLPLGSTSYSCNIPPPRDNILKFYLETFFTCFSWNDLSIIRKHKMPYQRVNRPPNAIPDSVAWKTLGLSRATFFRKLKEGALTAPIVRSGTTRRWWTPSDIEIARQELATNQPEMQT